MSVHIGDRQYDRSIKNDKIRSHVGDKRFDDSIKSSLMRSEAE